MTLIAKPTRPQHSPLVTLQLGNPKYQSWKAFLSGSSSYVDMT